MNKKMIILIIALLVVIFMAFGLYKASGLQKIQIQKSVIVKGTKEEVFDMVRYLKNFPKWSPFLAQDTSQKYFITGVDGAVGAQYHWDGNKGKDLGYQEIVQVDTFNFIGFKCDIQKPFVAKPVFNYTFKEMAAGIEVTQVFKLESGLMEAFFMWLFGAKTEMAKTNQYGLDLLKAAIEK